MKRLLIVLFVVCIMGTSCSKNQEDLNPYRDVPADQLFSKAKQALAKKDYELAVKSLEWMDSMYPFSKYSDEALLYTVYAYYKNSDPSSASATANRYIHLYPRSKNIAYAYYMKGLADFDQSRGVFALFIPMDESSRDFGTQLQAYKDFTIVVTRFPNSPYVEDAKQRLIYLRNNFAKKDLNIAKYYADREMYVAALNRAMDVIENYQQAPQTKEALQIAIKSSKALHLDEKAAELVKILHSTYDMT